jgi:hypothetical protein
MAFLSIYIRTPVGFAVLHMCILTTEIFTEYNLRIRKLLSKSDFLLEAAAEGFDFLSLCVRMPTVDSESKNTFEHNEKDSVSAYTHTHGREREREREREN